VIWQDFRISYIGSKNVDHGFFSHFPFFRGRCFLGSAVGWPAVGDATSLLPIQRFRAPNRNKTLSLAQFVASYKSLCNSRHWRLLMLSIIQAYPTISFRVHELEYC
jgi:hypothetical protein